MILCYLKKKVPIEEEWVIIDLTTLFPCYFKGNNKKNVLVGFVVGCCFGLLKYYTNQKVLL